MSDKLAAALAEADEIEADPDRVVRDDTLVTRGSKRDRTLQVRLTNDEYDELIEAAAAADLPASTLARSILLRGIRSPALGDGAAATIGELPKALTVMTVRHTELRAAIRSCAYQPRNSAYLVQRFLGIPSRSERGTADARQR